MLVGLKIKVNNLQFLKFTHIFTFRNSTFVHSFKSQEVSSAWHIHYEMIDVNVFVWQLHTTANVCKVIAMPCAQAHFQWFNDNTTGLVTVRLDKCQYFYRLFPADLENGCYAVK